MKYQQEIEIAKQQIQQTRKKFQKLAKGNKRKLDAVFHEEHEQVFKKIDCLSCANCCKTTSPVFRAIDIKRIAKKLKVSEQYLIRTYLKIDEDQDYVLQSSPCAFLYKDNTCQIYDVRPAACREYPHTNRKNMYQILDLTATNSLICPAVSLIIQKISTSSDE